MKPSRQLLPSISLLVAFEAVCRTGSTLSAARDLGITQGAVSRLIQSLESHLDVSLFRRKQRRLIPTETASDYVREIVRALSLIEEASYRVRSSTKKRRLSISVTSALGAYWLMPRLKEFMSENPDIWLELHAQDETSELEEGRFDAIIHHEVESWPDLEKKELLEECLVPVCTPGFLEKNSIQDPQDLMKIPILHLQEQEKIWKNWFHLQGIPMENTSTMSCNRLCMLLQATLEGAGMSLLPNFSVKERIQSGELVRISGVYLNYSRMHYFIYREKDLGYPPLRAFHRWLMRSSLQQVKSESWIPAESDQVLNLPELQNGIFAKDSSFRNKL